MTDDDGIPEEVPRLALRTLVNPVTVDLRIGSPSPAELKRISSQILDVSVEAFGKGMAFAERMDMQTSVLSEMRKGKRRVPYDVMLGLLAHEAAAGVVLRQECEFAGYPVPIKNTVQLTDSEARALDKVRRRLASMWPYFGVDLARQDYGVELDLLDSAIDLTLRLGK